MTARALLVGLGIGAVLAAANLYLGLVTGLWDSGHVTAAVLGAALGTALFPRRRFGILEINLAQTVATSAGAIPAAAGLLGAVPALAAMGAGPPGWAIAAWGAALGVLGTLLALLLRRRVIEEERLPFPTGIATAEVIRAGAGERGQRARALFIAGGIAGLIAVLRDARPILPATLALPLALPGLTAAVVPIGVSLSPLLIGVGMVVELHIGLSLLGGSVLAWGLLAPWLVGQGICAPDAAALSAWLTWPGVALLTGAAAVGLLEQVGSLGAGLRDLRAARAQLGSSAPGSTGGRDLRLLLALAGVAALAAVLLARAIFGLSPLHTVAALLFALPCAAVCARAAGLTDVSPVSQIGQLTQAAFGPALRGLPAQDIAAGALVAGGVAPVAVVLWSLRAGQLLSASVRRQAQAALLGALGGALVSAPLFAVLARAYAIPGPRLPAPTALQWKALAEVVAGGAAALPPGAAKASIAAAILGALLAALGRTRARRFVPVPLAVGIGFLLPAPFGVALFAGSALLSLWRRRSAAQANRLGPVVGAGLIAGESLLGLALALLFATGLLASP